MAEKTEPKGWAQSCVDGVDLKVADAARDLLTEQLTGLMQERPLKPGEIAKLATTLLTPAKGDQAEEKAA